MVSIGLLAASCAHDGGELPQESVATVAHAQEGEMAIPNAPQPPTLTSREVSERLLRLLDGLHGDGDLTPTAIERATGLAVAVAPEDPLRYGFHGRIDADWTFGLRALTRDGGGAIRGAHFYFNRAADNDGDMDAVCDPDFETYRTRLTAMGYDAAPVRGEHGRLLHWQFERGAIRLLAQVRGQSAARADRDCLSMLTIEV